MENCVKLRQRGLFVIIGDKGRDQVRRHPPPQHSCQSPAHARFHPPCLSQVVNLHYMLSKAVVKARPTVLWCYKKDLHLSRRGIPAHETLVTTMTVPNCPFIMLMTNKALTPPAPHPLYFLFSHRKKRMQQIRKQMQRGLLDPEKEDPFSLFVASTSIRYCYYSETQNILGNTFGMCVLQVQNVVPLRQPCGAPQRA